MEVSREECLAFFREHGGTPEVYFSDHFERFRKTFHEFDGDWKGGRRVLDIGAHWLHQALIWSRGGYAITAVEFPALFLEENVRRAASAANIRLLGCADLGSATDLSALPDDSADVVLFTEILEHITFNPIAFWKQIYRILAPGGRIIVTTPNYYSWRGRAWRPLRFLAGRGGGLPVEDVIGVGNYAHHWKEYSLGEVKRYFGLLSPDFVVAKAKRVPTYQRSRVGWKRAVQTVMDVMPLTRPNMHVEIALPQKRQGIVAVASY